ncbi:MAG: hypothetical protein EXR76_18155, partial [Myxococcales bacterium]|nr:hypothetical protein [Myxococcales bacterium]
MTLIGEPSETQPVPTSVKRRPDEAAWRQLRDLLERRAVSADVALSPMDSAALLLECGEIEATELGYNEAAQRFYQAALEADPSELTAYLSLRDAAVLTDDAALAVDLFERVGPFLPSLRPQADVCDAAELLSTFLLLFVFRWRDTVRAQHAADLLMTLSVSPALPAGERFEIRALLELLKPLFESPSAYRLALEARLRLTPDAETRTLLGVHILDTPAPGVSQNDEADHARELKRDHAREQELDRARELLEEVADQVPLAAFVLVERAAMEGRYAALAVGLERLARLYPPEIAASIVYLAAELHEWFLGDENRAAQLRLQARSGTL